MLFRSDLTIATGTTGDINLTAAADINLAATGADINMNAQLNITNTSADQFKIIYDGSNDFTTDVDIDGSTTLTTKGTNADFEIVTGTTGDITLDATGDIVLEAAGKDISMDAQLSITTTEATAISYLGLAQLEF